MTTKRINQILLIGALLVFGLLPLLACGCSVRVQVDPPDEVSIAKEAMRQMLEEQCKPVPDPAFSEDPAATPETELPADPLTPLEPLKPALPPHWPEGVMLQKFTADSCGPCKVWDREERPQLAGVMLNDITAWNSSGKLSPEAIAAGVSVCPFFQLKRGDQILWQGNGYFNAKLLVERAAKFGGN